MATRTVESNSTPTNSPEPNSPEPRPDAAELLQGEINLAKERLVEAQNKLAVNAQYLESASMPDAVREAMAASVSTLTNSVGIAQNYLSSLEYRLAKGKSESAAIAMQARLVEYLSSLTDELDILRPVFGGITIMLGESGPTVTMVEKIRVGAEITTSKGGERKAREDKGKPRGRRDYITYPGKSARASAVEGHWQPSEFIKLFPDNDAAKKLLANGWTKRSEIEAFVTTISGAGIDTSE